jgi:polyhydroxybutyrate depolymerase
MSVRLVIVMVLGMTSEAVAQTRPLPDTITVDGVVREYFVYRDPSTDTVAPAPLVLFFHGGGGTGLGAAERYGFNPAAIAGGAIVVYPSGVNHHWADGRDFYHDADDVAFVRALLRRLESRFRIDPRRVYAVGHSNGAIFANTLACRLPGVFAAIGTVGGSLASHDVARCQGAAGISVIAVHGTADPLAPYAGGSTGTKHGDILDAEVSIAHWAAVDGCRTPPTRTPRPPVVLADSTRVVRLDFPACPGGRAAVLYAIQGAGHDWPGGVTTLPEVVGGPITHQLDAGRVIWEFLAAHPARW